MNSRSGISRYFDSGVGKGFVLLRQRLAKQDFDGMNLYCSHASYSYIPGKHAQDYIQ